MTAPVDADAEESVGPLHAPAQAHGGVSAGNPFLAAVQTAPMPSHPSASASASGAVDITREEVGHEYSTHTAAGSSSGSGLHVHGVRHEGAEEEEPLVRFQLQTSLPAAAVGSQAGEGASGLLHGEGVSRLHAKAQARKSDHQQHHQQSAVDANAAAASAAAATAAILSSGGLRLAELPGGARASILVAALPGEPAGTGTPIILTPTPQSAAAISTAAAAAVAKAGGSSGPEGRSAPSRSFADALPGLGGHGGTASGTGTTGADGSMVLPPGWERWTDAEGDPYFYNAGTGASTWLLYWELRDEATGDPYFVDCETGESQWDKPEEGAVIVAATA